MLDVRRGSWVVSMVLQPRIGTMNCLPGVAASLASAAISLGQEFAALARDAATVQGSWVEMAYRERRPCLFQTDTTSPDSSRSAPADPVLSQYSPCWWRS